MAKGWFHPSYRSVPYLIGGDVYTITDVGRLTPEPTCEAHCKILEGHPLWESKGVAPAKKASEPEAAKPDAPKTESKAPPKKKKASAKKKKG